jgi:hypothetical protein
VWLTEEAIGVWHAGPRATRDGQPHYSTQRSRRSTNGLYSLGVTIPLSVFPGIKKIGWGSCLSR